MHCAVYIVKCTLYNGQLSLVRLGTAQFPGDIRVRRGEPDNYTNYFHSLFRPYNCLPITLIVSNGLFPKDRLHFFAVEFSTGQSGENCGSLQASQQVWDKQNEFIGTKVVHWRHNKLQFIVKKTVFLVKFLMNSFLKV